MTDGGGRRAGPAGAHAPDAAAGHALDGALRSLDLPRRRVLAGGALGAAAAGAMVWSGPAEAALGPTRSAAARRAVDPASVSYVPTRRHAVALTFDDGPDPRTTPAVLDLLARHRARATFFVVGRSADAHPELVRRIVAEGHALGNHTYDHAPLERLPQAEVVDQLRRGRAVVDRSWNGPRYCRPPRGYTSPVVAAACAQLGERAVFWTGCLEAVHAGSARQEGLDLAGPLRGGAIVLAHDGGRTDGPFAQRYDRSRTVEALAGLLAGLARAGLAAVTLPDLLGEA